MSESNFSSTSSSYSERAIDSWSAQLRSCLKLFSSVTPCQIGFIFIFCLNFLFSKDNQTIERKSNPDCLTVISSTPILKKRPFRLSYRMGYFRPSNEIMREIYHKGISYQLEFDWNFWKGLFFFSNLDYFANSGHSLNFHSDTCVRIVGWVNGLGYLYQWTSWIGLYAGIGPKAFFYHNRDHAPYVQQKISKNAVGMGVKSGLLLFPYKWTFVDLFVDYSYCKIHFKSERNSNILRFSTNAGGLTVGGGIGARF